MIRSISFCIVVSVLVLLVNRCRKLDTSFTFCTDCTTKCSGRSNGEQNGPEMLSALERQVEEYNLRCGEIYAKIEKSSGGTLLVDICSPH